MSWVPYDLDQARKALAKWPTLRQIGYWHEGFIAGAMGDELTGNEALPFLDGHAAGKTASEARKA